jgi:hypothetical protein
MGSISQDGSHQVRDEPTVYDSRAFSRLQIFKQGLVLDLFLQRGLFWERVRQLRKERGIAASVQLPPEAAESWMEPMRLFPSDAPEYQDIRLRHQTRSTSTDSRIVGERILVAYLRRYSQTNSGPS